MSARSNRGPKVSTKSKRPVAVSARGAKKPEKGPVGLTRAPAGPMKEPSPERVLTPHLSFQSHPSPILPSASSSKVSRSRLFDDANPRPGIFLVDAREFINRKIPNYEYQRSVSAERVQQIVEEQHRAAFLFFATPLILVHVNGMHKLCDGQHRVQALVELHSEGHPDIETLQIWVQVHVCQEEFMAERVYLQANNQYMRNGAIDRMAGVIHRDTAVRSREVADGIAALYSAQIGSSFPNFDPNCLAEELNKSRILHSKTVEEMVEIIRTENEAYGAILLQQNAKKYYQCLGKGKSGFFLPAKEPKCRWILTIVRQYA